LLLKGVLPILLVEIGILIAWTVADPLIPTVIEPKLSVLLQPDQTYTTCRSKSIWPVTIYLVAKGLLLCFGVIVSYKIKDVKKKLYNESKIIGWAIYNTSFVGVIAIAILLITPYSVAIEAGIICYAIILIVVGVLVFVFAPKVIRLNVKHSDTTMTTTQLGSVKSTFQQSENISSQQ